MKFRAWLGLAFLGLGGLGASWAEGPSVVWVAEIRGTINPASADYLETSIRAAEAARAEALIVELDTPGGLVSSVQAMAQAVDRSTVPVVVYVTPAGASATSAGALLTLASHVAAMAPGSHIGAAHPVDSSGKDIPGTMGEKAVNDTAAFARGLAEVRGRNRELAEQLVRKSRSFTAAEALKENLVELLAGSREELLEKIDGRRVKLTRVTGASGGATAGPEHVLKTRGTAVHAVGMSWGQKFLHLIADPNIAALLMTLGVLCLYVEITTPGVTIPGVLGIVMLLVGFMSFQVLPIRIGGLLLLLLGIAMFIGELFATTHGALALGGTLSFLLGLLWVMDPTQSDLRISLGIAVPAVLALGGGAMVMAFAAARTRRLSLQARALIGGGGSSGLLGYLGRVESVESDGARGKALIRGETWDVESEERLRVGDPIEVVEVMGFRVRVKRKI